MASLDSVLPHGFVIVGRAEDVAACMRHAGKKIARQPRTTATEWFDMAEKDYDATHKDFSESVIASEGKMAKKTDYDATLKDLSESVLDLQRAIAVIDRQAFDMKADYDATHKHFSDSVVDLQRAVAVLSVQTQIDGVAKQAVAMPKVQLQLAILLDQKAVDCEQIEQVEQIDGRAKQAVAMPEPRTVDKIVEQIDGSAKQAVAMPVETIAPTYAPPVSGICAWVAEELSMIYRERNPNKLGDVLKQLNTKYVGQEYTLYHKVCKKYGVTPSMKGLEFMLASLGQHEPSYQ